MPFRMGSYDVKQAIGMISAPGGVDYLYQLFPEGTIQFMIWSIVHCDEIESVTRPDTKFTNKI